MIRLTATAIQKILTAGVLLLSSLCVYPYQCDGQPVTFINYTIKEGLPSNQVYEILQDEKGFLWFGTDNGVFHFDGHEMERFGVEHGLTDPVVFGLYEDYKGRIWFRTFSGKISFYENGKITAFTHNDTLRKAIANSIISAMYVDSTDRLWFSCYREKGIWGSIDAKGRIDIHDPTGHYSNYFVDTPDGVLYGYTNNVLEKKIRVDEKVFPLQLSFNCGNIPITLAVRWHGKSYVSVCQEIFECSAEGIKKVFTAPAAIISLSIDSHNNLWVGYGGAGATRIVAEDFVSQQVPEFLAELSVTRVLSDHEGGLWFSTLEAGIFYVPNVLICNYQPFAGSKILFTTTSSDHVFVSTNRSTVFKFARNGEVILKNELPFSPRGIFARRNGEIWISNPTEAGIYDQGLKLTRKFRVSTHRMMEDVRGSLWSSNGNQSIFKSDGDSYQQFHLPFLCRNVMVIDSTVYLTSRGEVFRSDLNLRSIREIKPLAGYKLSGISKLNDSTVLMTTIGRGFLLYKPATDQFIEYHLNNKFTARNIYDLINDGTSLWFATESGLLKLNTSALLRGKMELDFLSHQSGLITSEIYHLAGFDDAIWAFSDNGFSIVEKDNARFANKAPRFYIKSVSVNDRPVLIRANESLQYDHNNIKIDFGFISFNNQKVFARYRLHPDVDWNYTTARSLQFYALAPGDFDFELQYSTDNTNWISAYRIPSLVILPPLWKRWFFQLGLGLLIMLIIFLYFRSQLLLYRRHQKRLVEAEIQTLEKERTRIAKDLHDSVGTDFTAIKMMVNQELQKYDEQKTRVIENQFQHTLNEIKNIIYDLSPPGLERYGLMSSVRNYVQRLNDSLNIHIEFNSFGPEIKKLNISIIVFRILQELITNSVKHSQATSINLHLNAFEDMLNIMYEDNGKGFVFSTPGKGFGLYNIESRVQSLNGKLKFESGNFGVSYTIDIPLADKNEG
jgi:signal transduction histidine kinase/ligand-binding sensor domain-containing protein